MIAKRLRAQSTLDPAVASEVGNDKWSSDTIGCLEVKYEITCLSQQYIRLQIYCVVLSVYRC